MKKELMSALEDLSITELEQLIESIAAEMARRDAMTAERPSPAELDENEIVQVLAFELKRHRKQKDEVFNPFA